VTPEHVSRFERLAGAALAALEAETRARFARLREVGSAGTGDEATDAYWPTAQALRALEEAAFDPLVLSAAEVAEAEAGDGLDESPFS
jgi:hypothetical protein